MPLLAGASPVAIAAVAAGVMLGKTETASQTASPLCARAPKCGASPSRMAACSTSGLIPSSTKSRTGLGPLFSALVKAALVYPVAQPPERITTLPALRDEGPGQDREKGYWPAAGEALDGASCCPAAGEADSCPPAPGAGDSWPGLGAAPGPGDADDAPPPGFLPPAGFPPPAF